MYDQRNLISTFNETALQDRREERRVYLFMIGACLAFVALVAPYRSVHLPQVLLISLAALLALFCLKFAVEDYDKLLLLFAIYAPFQKVLAGDFGGLMDAFNLTNILGFFLIIGWLSRSFMNNEPIYKRTAIDFPLVFFIFLSSISVLRGELMLSAGDIFKPLFELKRWLMPMILYFIVFNNIRNNRTMRRLVVAVAVTTAMIGFLSIKKFYLDKGGLSGSVSIRRARLTVIADQPNNLGAFFCYYTFLLVAFWAYNLSRLKAWLLLLPIAACTRSMLLTFSRGAQVSFLVGLTVFALLRSRKFFILAFVPLIIFFTINPNMIPGFMVGRMQNTVQADGSLDASANGRLMVWKGALRVIRDYPVWGVGFENFRQYIWRPEYGVHQTLDAHNIYLLIAAEMGLIAFGAFMVVLLIIMYKAMYVFFFAETQFQRLVATGFIAGYSAMLVANLFGSRLKSNEIVFQFWILTAVVVKMASVIKEARVKRIEEAQKAWEEISGFSI